MGRETVAVVDWLGERAEVKLHLDSRHLELRGAIRADIPRSAIARVTLHDDGLAVETGGPNLRIELGAEDALRWQKALLKKLPTLAEKLGVSADSTAFVLGDYDDAALTDALTKARVDDVDAAVILLAIVMEEADVRSASALALAHPEKHIWMIYRKGKAAIVGDTMIRTHMRDLGFIDSKTSAVSDQLTGTRYRLRAK